MARQVIQPGLPNAGVLNETGNRAAILAGGVLANENTGASVSVTMGVGRIKLIGALLAAGVAAATTMGTGRAAITGRTLVLSAGTVLSVQRGVAARWTTPPAIVPGAGLAITIAAPPARLRGTGKPMSAGAGFGATLGTAAATRWRGRLATVSAGGAQTLSAGYASWIGELFSAAAGTSQPAMAATSAGRFRFFGQPVTISVVTPSRQTINIGYPAPNLINEAPPRDVILPGVLLNSNLAHLGVSVAMGRSRARFIGSTISPGVPILTQLAAPNILRLRGQTITSGAAVSSAPAAAVLRARTATPSVVTGAFVTMRTGVARFIAAPVITDHGVIAQFSAGKARLIGKPIAPSVAAIMAAGRAAWSGRELTTGSGTGSFVTFQPARLKALPGQAKEAIGVDVNLSRGRLVARGTPTIASAAVNAKAPGPVLFAIRGQPILSQISVVVSVTIQPGRVRFRGGASTAGAGVTANTGPGAATFITPPIIAGAGIEADIDLPHPVNWISAPIAGASGGHATPSPGRAQWRGQQITSALEFHARPGGGRLQFIGRPMAISGISWFLTTPPAHLSITGEPVTTIPAVPVAPAVARDMPIDQRVRIMPLISDTTLDPPPIDYGAMSVADVDRAFKLDCLEALTARGDTLTMIGSPIVWRNDGQDMTAADIAITNIGLFRGATAFGWTITANGNAATYLASFPLTLGNTGTIWRTIRIKTLSAIG